MSTSPEHQEGTQGPADAEVTATFAGPWPGTDPVEAAKVSLGLFTPPHLPALPELPGRGVGSDAVGRTAALLVELPVDVQPYGWRFVDRPGADLRRAASALATDINVLADVAGAAGSLPPEVKVQAVGPASLAAAIHLHFGERALVDHGARRDVAQSLAAGLAPHAAKIRAAVPGAALTLQLDEPDIAPALAGTIPTVSGYRTLRALPASELRALWGVVADAARQAGFAAVALNLAPDGGRVSAPAGPGVEGLRRAEDAAWLKALELALECGVDAVAVPLSRLDAGSWETLAGAVESGTGVWAGAVPVPADGTDADVQPRPYGQLVERIMRPWRGLGLPAAALDALRITPEGSLAPLSPRRAREVAGRTLEVAAALTDLRHA